MFAYLFADSYVAFINLKAIQTGANGLITFAIGVLTVWFLWLQIRKLRSELEEKRKEKQKQKEDKE